MASPGDSSDSDCESSTATAGVQKKPKKAARFLTTWKLPPGIIASKKGPEFAFCKYCSVDFGIGHGGFNDITRHVKTKSHENKGRVLGWWLATGLVIISLQRRMTACQPKC